jgi:hypothetical protein
MRHYYDINESTATAALDRILTRFRVVMRDSKELRFPDSTMISDFA